MVIIKKKIDFTVRPYVKLKRNVSYFYNCFLIYVEWWIQRGSERKIYKTLQKCQQKPHNENYLYTVSLITEIDQ